MAAIFLASFQIVKPAAPGVAGLAFEYRRPEQTVLAVASKPEEVGEVVAQNVDLKSNEVVEITQWRQLEPARKVFQGKVGA